MRKIAIVALMMAAPAMAQSEDRMMLAAKAFLGQAEACLLDVRDKSAKFETSTKCQPLGAFHYHYLASGGGRPDTPAEIELIAEKGRKTAWNAKAVSATGEGRETRIW